MPFAVHFIVVIVKGELPLFAKCLREQDERLPHIREILRKRQIPYAFLPVLKRTALQPLQLLCELADLSRRKMREIEEIDHRLQILWREHMIPVPVKRKRRFLPIHHARHLAAHHRQPRLLQAEQISGYRLAAHDHPILALHKTKNVLLRQRVILVRLAQKDLHDADDRELAARLTACHRITSLEK